MKERFYSNLTAVLEDKRNNCIFFSRKVILRHRIGWGNLRTTQTGKTRRTLKSSKATSYVFPKKSCLSSLWSINEFQTSTGYDWEAKTSSWGIQIFFSVSRSHDEVLATASVKNSKAEDVAFALLYIFAVLRNAYFLESGNDCERANRIKSLPTVGQIGICPR